MLAHVRNALLWPHLYRERADRLEMQGRHAPWGSACLQQNFASYLADPSTSRFLNQFLLVENILRGGKKSLPFVEFINYSVKVDFSAIEFNRFVWRIVSYRCFMTVRAIFARRVSTLMHCSNRPVQSRPGGRCVDLFPLQYCRPAWTMRRHCKMTAAGRQEDSVIVEGETGDE